MAYRRLRLFQAHIRTLVTLDVDGRLAYQILDFADRYGRPTGEQDILVPLRLTQGELANLIGASREWVNKVITTYKQRRYLSITPSYHITIHNREALAQRCG